MLMPPRFSSSIFIVLVQSEPIKPGVLVLRDEKLVMKLAHFLDSWLSKGTVTEWILDTLCSFFVLRHPIPFLAFISN